MFFSVSRFQLWGKVFFAVLLIVLLAGCSAKKAKEALGFSPRQPDTPQALAMKGLNYYNHGKYEKALTSFEAIMNRYPFSEYSMLAKLKSADSNYYLENYEEALLTYKDFEQDHPTNEAMPYVLYQMGMCNHKQIDTIDRDTSGAIKSIYAFIKLLRAYPNSPYTKDATERINEAKNFLADHEYYVAAFYVRTQAYSEAEGRLEYLLRQYPEADAAPKAEKLLVALKSGNRPKRKMWGLLPGFKIPDVEQQPDPEETKPTEGGSSQPQ
jgi:outer membrane protein assembly factor BamD